MPAVQRTFELVPTSLARTVARPPMTSKAAKKAYQKAQSGPRISRAEQKKRDAEALERLRKEHEKERAAAKAKAAREKKAAKAAEEREERRKLGLPEPRRGVGASQSMISLFVQGGGNGGANANGKRGWKEIESVEGGDTIGEEVGTEAEPPRKRDALDHDYQREDTRLQDTVNPTKEMKSADLDCEDELSAKRVALDDGCRIEDTKLDQSVKPVEMDIADPNSDDEFGDFPSLTQTDILEKLDSSMSSNTEIPPPPVSSQLRLGKKQEVNIHKPLPRSPDIHVRLDEQDFWDIRAFEEVVLKLPKRETVPDVDEFDDGMASTQFFQEAIEVVSRIESREVTPAMEGNAVDLDLAPVMPLRRSASKSPITVNTEAIEISRTRPVLPFQRATVASERRATPKVVSPARRPVLGESSVNTPPPKLPLLGPKPTPFVSPAIKARLIPQASRLVTPARSPFTPKPNFLVNGRKITPMAAPPRRPHFLPGNQSKSNRYLSHAPPSATQAFLENNLEDFYPSPTQEKRELDEIMDDASFLPSNTQIARDISPSKPAPKAQSIKFDEFQFPSTQDFMISSQDMCEINTPKSTLVTVPKAVLVPAVPQPVFKEKRRFFEEKEEDLRQAGLLGDARQAGTKPQEPVGEVAQVITLSAETLSIQAPIVENKELIEIRRLADAIFDNFDDDDSHSLSQAIRESEKVPNPNPKSFEEDIEELEAAIRESERLALAQQESQRLEPGLGGRRFFQEKEEDLVEAALWESKRLLAQQARDRKAEEVRKHIQTVPVVSEDTGFVKEKRTLKRAASNITDYGEDDDFISSQELLALCDGFDT